MASRDVRERLVLIDYAPHRLDKVLQGLATGDPEAVWGFLATKSVPKGEKAVDAILERLRACAVASDATKLNTELQYALLMGDGDLASELSQQLAERLGLKKTDQPAPAVGPGL